MVDFSIQIVRREERPPSLEDGMCHLQNTNIDLGIVG